MSTYFEKITQHPERKGGGEWGSAPSALTVSKCENFGPIFPNGKISQNMSTCFEKITTP